MHPHPQIRPAGGRVPEPSPGLTLRTAAPSHPAEPGSARGGPPTQTRVRLSLLPNPTLAAPRMAEFGAGGAGRRDEDRRALKEGKKLLKKALGAAGLASKEKLRREKQRRRDAEARAEAERRTTMAARRAELHQRATAAAAERRRQADSKSHAEDRARVARATEALEADRAADAAVRAEFEADSKSLESERAAAARERAAFAAARAEAEGDFKSVAAERALADRATEALAAERAASQARAQREAEAERRRQAAERELDEAREVSQAYTIAVETELADARAVAARTQEFYETERGEREAAERNVRALRDQIRTMEQELEEFEGGGFTDVCGLFSGVSGGVAARARGTALREAKQELERRRAELAAAQAEAAARTAAVDAALRERDAAAAEAERERARWYAASFELQTAEKHAQNTLDLKNLELREQAERSNATEAELRRLKAELEEARSTAEAQRSRAQFYVTEAQRRDASGGNGDHRVRYLEAEVERLERERDLERERASRQARLTETQLRFAEAELGRTRETPNPGPTAADDPMRAVARDHPDGIAKEMLDGEEAVKSVDYATAGAAPTPAGPFSGSQSFSIGTSSAPKRGKAGRRILKAKRPAHLKAKRPPPVADLYMESTFEAGGAAVRIVGLSNHGLNGRRGRVALEQLQDLIDRGRMLVHVAHELLPFALENVRAEPGSEAELERLKAYIRQARLTAEAQNSQARWVSSPFLPWAPSPPDTTRPIPEEMKRRLLRVAEANAAAERIAAMRDADAKRIVADAELGRANLDSVRRLQRDWYTACLPAEDEWGAAATSRPGPAAWGWSSPAEQTPAAAAAASPFVPPPAPRAPQPAVVQQTTYYSSSPSPQIYMPRPAPTPPRRSSSGGARMGTVLRNDGMPDRRYASPRPVTTSGRPDRRFSVNRPATSSTRSSGSSSGRRSGGTRRK